MRDRDRASTTAPFLKKTHTPQSGLITALIVFICLRYWNAVIVPWYENRIYKDIKIDGEWKALGDEQSEVFEEKVKVKQNAHRVYGDIIYKSTSELIEYQFEGEFRNLILTARYWVKGENNLDRGTFTLMTKNNGRTLKGPYAWYSANNNDVESGTYEWDRLY